MTRKHLSNPWFSLIKEGTKIYEGRICEGYWSKIKIGDKITFYNEDGKDKESYNVEIEEISYYKSFKEGIEKVGLEKILPTQKDKNISTAINDVYYQYYTKESEEKYGIVLFKIKVI
jgi:ASC-1-like (ASCH) protein